MTGAHSACFAAPTDPQPAAPTPVVQVAASIELNGISGIGASAGHGYVGARVLDTSGRGIPAAVVLFSGSDVVFAKTLIVADYGGLAQATFTTTLPRVTIAATSNAVSELLTLDIVQPR